MKQETPYILKSAAGKMSLYVGNRTNKETGALIFEPLVIEDAQILMLEDLGPQLIAGSQLWPVRTYRSAYSLDKLMYSDRFKNNPQAISLYSFERQAAAGFFCRIEPEPSEMATYSYGELRCVALSTLRSLENRVLVLPTERRNELRLLKPFCEAVAEIEASAAVRGC
ncbi:MAG: hypothetical protein HEQ17_00370 [Limnohabitans sp.]|jgi:hypothetical protein|uniref:hypothetical protein n=1 Tax=Limnohabitans sp. TaxID=1907725 RepID=UPI0025D2D633|nr:hypothetical protein [Limnohabitans sp.]MCO4087466.1 hypothetical protein [Limnohabitans sp.]